MPRVRDILVHVSVEIAGEGIEACVAHSVSERSSTCLWMSSTTSAHISCSPSLSINGSTLRADATNATATLSVWAQARIRASNNIARNTVTGVSAKVLTNVCQRARRASPTSRIVGSVAGTLGSKATRANGETLAGVSWRVPERSTAVCLRRASLSSSPRTLISPLFRNRSNISSLTKSSPIGSGSPRSGWRQPPSAAREERRPAGFGGRTRPWVRILAQRGLAGQTEPVFLGVAGGGKGVGLGSDNGSLFNRPARNSAAAARPMPTSLSRNVARVVRRWKVLMSTKSSISSSTAGVLQLGRTRKHGRGPPRSVAGGDDGRRRADERQGPPRRRRRGLVDELQRWLTTLRGRRRVRKRSPSRPSHRRPVARRERHDAVRRRRALAAASKGPRSRPPAGPGNRRYPAPGLESDAQLRRAWGRTVRQPRRGRSCGGSSFSAL